MVLTVVSSTSARLPPTSRCTRIATTAQDRSVQAIRAGDPLQRVLQRHAEPRLAHRPRELGGQRVGQLPDHRLDRLSEREARTQRADDQLQRVRQQAGEGAGPPVRAVAAVEGGADPDRHQPDEQPERAGEQRQQQTAGEAEQRPHQQPLVRPQAQVGPVELGGDPLLQPAATARPARTAPAPPGRPHRRRPPWSTACRSQREAVDLRQPPPLPGQVQQRREDHQADDEQADEDDDQHHAEHDDRGSPSATTSPVAATARDRTTSRTGTDVLHRSGADLGS